MYIHVVGVEVVHIMFTCLLSSGNTKSTVFCLVISLMMPNGLTEYLKAKGGFAVKFAPTHNRLGTHSSSESQIVVPVHRMVGQFFVAIGLGPDVVSDVVSVPRSMFDFSPGDAI